MLCQECRRNEANIHIVKHAEGKQTELNLCEQCARKKDELDFSFEPQFSLHKLFAGMLSQTLRGSRESMSAASSQCPTCGLTFPQFTQIGRLGCSDCFTAFEDKLRPLLRRIHGGCLHTGKVPVKVRTRVRFLRELDRLKDDLKRKVENEEFEEAAMLRDRIRSMESDINSKNTAEIIDGTKTNQDSDQPEKGDTSETS
jgi:protein arginine kinase activator